MARKKKVRKEKEVKKKKEMRIEGGFFKRNYVLSWKYLKKCRNHILFIILIFLLSAIIGLYFQPAIIVDWIREFVEELLARTEGLNWWQMIVFILNNNLRSSFFGMIFGLALGVFPVITAFANGYILGFVSQRTVTTEGLSVLWRLLPHGIFELPAVIMSLALGTKLGLFWFSKERKKEFLIRVQESLRVFLFIIIPLLIIAAIIEGLLIVFIG